MSYSAFSSRLPAQSRGGRPEEGQVFVEFTVVLPIVLAGLLGLLQVLLLLQAELRMEAAAAAAARSYLVEEHEAVGGAGSAALRKVQATLAMQMAPVSPSALGTLRTSAQRLIALGDAGSKRWQGLKRGVDSAFDGLAAVRRIPGVGTKLAGVDRLLYAWRYADVEVCARGEMEDRDWSGRSVRLTIRFHLALLVPVAGRLLARIESGHEARTQGRTITDSPIFAGLAELDHGIAEQFAKLEEVLQNPFRSMAKRSLTRRVSVIWPHHARPPGLLGACPA
jgi:hypothetical protein